MRWSDSQRTSRDVGTEQWLRGSNLERAARDAEARATGRAHVNSVETTPPSWESAWIDLGGEG